MAGEHTKCGANFAIFEMYKAAAMRFLKRLLGLEGDKALGKPDIQFGRFTDAHKADENYDAWDRSVAYFDQGDYTGSFMAFFRYLEDADKSNIRCWEEKNLIKFEIMQGSKLIRGYVDGIIFKAIAKVARARELNVSFMRRLMEQNFVLRYARFCLDPDSDLAIVFDSQVSDASPYKLYYALKELALSADKQDDLLVDEFDQLERINDGHIRVPSPQELSVKVRYLRKSITDALSEIQTGSTNLYQHAGGAAYILLDLAFRLDYLLRPESFVMEKLEAVSRIFFAQDRTPVQQKVVQMKRELELVLERSDDELAQEFYKAAYTFGITTPVNHDRLSNFITGELGNMNWYTENGHTHAAMAVPGYIVGYTMFNYALPEPDMGLLHLYYEITEQAYFNELGYDMEFVDEQGKLNRREIRSAVERVEELYADRYATWSFPRQQLDTNSLTGFARSYLEIVRDLNIRRK